MDTEEYTLLLRLPADEARRFADELDCDTTVEARRAALLSSVRDFGEVVEFRRIIHTEFVL